MIDKLFDLYKWCLKEGHKDKAEVIQGIIKELANEKTTPFIPTYPVPVYPQPSIPYQPEWQRPFIWCNNDHTGLSSNSLRTTGRELIQ